MHYDSVAVDRALHGDSKVRLLDGEIDEILRRQARGEIDSGTVYRVLGSRMSGTTLTARMKLATQ